MMLITALLLTNVAALAPPLRTLLSRSAKPKAREEAIALITEMERDERDKFLDYVNTVRETPGKLARRPLMRYAPVSWPARDVAALDRVLAIGGVPEDDASKRRAVLSTLRQLANTRGVLRLEREARRRARLAASFDEMLERTPKIGTPAFEIVEEQGAFQVRRYEDFSVVRTARQQAVSDDGVKLGEPKMSGAGAFQALAGYIFGKNKREEKMAMTTPVFTRAGPLPCRNSTAALTPSTRRLDSPQVRWSSYYRRPIGKILARRRHRCRTWSSHLGKAVSLPPLIMEATRRRTRCLAARPSSSRRSTRARITPWPARPIPRPTTTRSRRRGDGGTRYSSR